jgi:hypothetical protein
VYTNTSNTPPRIDSITAREGSFSVNPGGSPEVEVRLAYTNKERGEGWGYFDARSSMFSKKTLEALNTFLEYVEEDVGGRLFTEGALNLPSPLAESNDGLSFKGLGGK